MGVREKAILARNASIELAALSTKDKNKALKAIAASLEKNKGKILEANKKDVKNNEGKIPKALLDRLKLDESKLGEIVAGVEAVEKQPDLVGKTLSAIELDKGLELFQVSSPIGVICAIFESRPDALVQISTLCFKAGNSVILKGGSEAKESNEILAEIIRNALESSGITKECILLIETREEVKEVLALDDLIDLIIPRGSNQFVKYIQDNTRIPVLGHSSGICHIYVDENADLDKAVDICIDAKVQYAAVCNAMETMLVNATIANEFLPTIGKKLNEKKVEIFCDSRAKEILAEAGIDCRDATEESWKTEYNDLKLNVKIVDSLDEAIAHINKYSSKHTDAIVTENKQNAIRFINKVDSSSIMWNASTRFSDGYRYGKGSEIGINTGKTHARGPAGMEALVTYKYILVGKNHKVSDYVGRGAGKFSHKKLNKKWLNE